MKYHERITVNIGGKLYNKSLYRSFMGDYVRHNGNKIYVRVLKA